MVQPKRCDRVLRGGIWFNRKGVIGCLEGDMVQPKRCDRVLRGEIIMVYPRWTGRRGIWLIRGIGCLEQIVQYTLFRF